MEITLISHIPSKATTFEDYHISISFFGSVRIVSKWEYQKSIVSNIYHRIQLWFKLSDKKKITTFVSSWYILLSGPKIVLCNQQTSEILVYYWYFLWIQDRSSAHPMKLAASNIEIKLTKAPVEFFYTSLQKLTAVWNHYCQLALHLLKLLDKMDCMVQDKAAWY